MGTVADTDKNEYRNVTGGQLGVTIENVDGKPQGIAVAPDDTVWMSESERIRTANAPRDPANNPFTNGSLVKVTEGGNIKSKRAIDTETVEPEEQPEPVPPAPGAPPAGEPEGGVPREERPPDGQEPTPPPAPPEPNGDPDDATGATPTPATPPVEGSPAPGEEVATPQPSPSNPRQAPTGEPNVRSGPEIEAPAAPSPEEPAAVQQTTAGLRRTAVKRSDS